MNTEATQIDTAHNELTAKEPTSKESTAEAVNTEASAPAAETAKKTEVTEADESGLLDIADFFRTDLRVAEIVEAEAVPKSKKLLKLKVNLGPLGDRQILAGISLHYTPEELIGKKIIIVANLKPAKLMGHESQGMLLAASSEDNSVVTLVHPGGDVPAGAKVG